MPDDETDYIGDALAESRARHPDATEATSRPRPHARAPEPGTTPTFCIVAGLVTMIVGMLVSLGGGGFTIVGAILGTFGAVVAGVGVVAAGVRLGMEWADYDRASRGR